MKTRLIQLIEQAPWREAVMFRETWPHEYVMSSSQHQRELLAAICDRFRAGEGVPGRFFKMENTYLFIGSYKYWLMTHYEKIDPYFDQDNYAINRAPLYRDRRDFVIQEGDTGRARDYPSEPALRRAGNEGGS